jgi:excisionase family DNA binding protein
MGTPQNWTVRTCPTARAIKTVCLRQAKSAFPALQVEPIGLTDSARSATHGAWDGCALGRDDPLAGAGQIRRASTHAEAAEILGVSASTVARMVRRGELRSHRSKPCLTRRQVEALAEQRRLFRMGTSRRPPVSSASTLRRCDVGPRPASSLGADHRAAAGGSTRRTFSGSAPGAWTWSGGAKQLRFSASQPAVWRNSPTPT